MYAIDHALFLGLNNIFSNEHNPIILHGHGLDYMFQGMYLHSRRDKWFGTPMYSRKLNYFLKNLAEFFRNSIPYALRYNFENFSLKFSKTYYETFLLEDITAIIKKGNRGFQDHDLWNTFYFIIHQDIIHLPMY